MVLLEEIFNVKDIFQNLGTFTVYKLLPAVLILLIGWLVGKIFGKIIRSILKKLKGPYKGILQYDITKDDARVWYRVDKKENLVIIKYAGHHPDKH